jgi:hypothetical protein
VCCTASVVARVKLLHVRMMGGCLFVVHECLQAQAQEVTSLRWQAGW